MMAGVTDFMLFRPIDIVGVFGKIGKRATRYHLLYQVIVEWEKERIVGNPGLRGAREEDNLSR